MAMLFGVTRRLHEDLLLRERVSAEFSLVICDMRRVSFFFSGVCGGIQSRRAEQGALGNLALSLHA